MPLRALRSLSVPLALTLAVAANAQNAQNSLTKDSPFAPQGGGTAAPAASTETIEFVGVSTVGKKTDLAFADKAQKKSRWVGVGETVDGLSVLNYDSRLEQAVIKVDGVQKILPLKKSTNAKGGVAAVAPMQTGFNVAPPPLPAAPLTVTPSTQPSVPSTTGVPPSAMPPAAPVPQQPATPETQAKQEQEARMLVSDLLEIGMAQRKAYEEAQRKASEGTPPPTNAAPAPTSPSGQPVAPTP